MSIGAWIRALARGLARFGAAGLAALHQRVLARATFPWLVKVSAAGLGFTLLVLFFWPVMTNFVVVAETEVVRAATAEGSSVSWRLPGATVCAGEPAFQEPDRAIEKPSPCAGASVALEDFNGHLDLQGVLEVRVERLSGGPLEISLRPVGESFRVRARSADGKPRAAWLKAPVNVRLAQPSLPSGRGIPVSLPLVARSLTFGKEAALEGVWFQPVLRSGSVTLIGRSLLGNRPYAARKVVLEQGDTVTAEDTHSPFSCLLRVDERPALQGLFRVRAYQLAIRGFFSEARIVSLSFLDKVLNDRLFTAISSLFGLVVAAMASLWNARKDS